MEQAFCMMQRRGLDACILAEASYGGKLCGAPVGCIIRHEMPRHTPYSNCATSCSPSPWSFRRCHGNLPQGRSRIAGPPASSCGRKLKVRWLFFIRRRAPIPGVQDCYNQGYWQCVQFGCSLRASLSAEAFRRSVESWAFGRLRAASGAGTLEDVAFSVWRGWQPVWMTSRICTKLGNAGVAYRIQRPVKLSRFGGSQNV